MTLITSELANAFKALGDPTRLRVLLLLRQEEMSVSELTEVLRVPQSTASGLLRTLLDADLVVTRPEGRTTFYRASTGVIWAEAALASQSLSEEDLQALARLKEARATAVPPEVSRSVLPGRSWEGLARALLAVTDLGVVADFGVGTGELTLLLASAARCVQAVDISQPVLDALAKKAREGGIAHIVPVQADFEEHIPPLPCDLVLLSQSLHCAERPDRVLGVAFRALKPGGRVLVMDLLAHDQSWVRSRLGHQWLGFSPEELTRLLQDAGFASVSLFPGGQDTHPPRFKSVLAVGTRPRHSPSSPRTGRGAGVSPKEST